MRNSFRLMTGAVAAAAVLGLTTISGVAQTSTQPATKAPAPAAAPAAKAPVAKKAATPSACKGLEKAACEAKADCSYVAETTRKDGKKVSAYCRSKPATTAKAAPAAKQAPAAAPATKAAPASPAAPAAPAKKS